MRRTAFCFLFALIGGCGAGQSGSPAGSVTPSTTRVDTPERRYEFQTIDDGRVTSHVVRAPADRAWRELFTVYEDLGIAIGSFDTLALVLGSPRVKARRALKGVRLSRILECGSTVVGPNADSYYIAFDMTTKLEPLAGGITGVKTRLKAQASPASVATNSLACSSTGWLEERIAKLLSERTTS